MATRGGSPPAPEGGSTRLPRAARRAQIIETAAGAFLKAGFDSTSMDEVAEAAGISRLLIYRNFETKKHLYRAVLGSVTRRAHRRVRAARPRRRSAGVAASSASCWRSPGGTRTPSASSGGRPHTNRHSSPSPIGSARVLGEYAETFITMTGRDIEPRMMPWCATVLAAHLLDGHERVARRRRPVPRRRLRRAAGVWTVGVDRRPGRTRTHPSG